MRHERQGGEKCSRETGEVEIRWKPRGNQTTTNRRGTKTSTTFCVFLLTPNLHPLILRIQIRGTWKRQTDLIGDGTRSVWDKPRGSPGSKRKNRARIPCSAPVFQAGHPAVRLSVNHRPAAEHWRFVLGLACGWNMAGFFFAARFHEPVESRDALTSAQTLKRSAAPLWSTEE